MKFINKQTYGRKRTDDTEISFHISKLGKGASRRLMALVLTVCMIGTMLPASVFAYATGDGGDTIEVTGFAPLQEEETVRCVPLGVSSVDLGLPSELTATVYAVSEDTSPTLPPDQEEPTDSGKQETLPKDDRPAQSEAPPANEENGSEAPDTTLQIDESDIPLAATPSEPEQSEELATPPVGTVVISAIEWDSAPLYNENEVGEYIFTAVLPEQYALAEGVALPEIAVTVYDGAKVISAWTWNDPDSLINEGVLALPGVNAENPIDLDALLSMLPASINATLDTQAVQDSGEVEHIPVSVALTWSSKDFVQAEDGSWPVQGSFVFTGTMQEGYTLAEGASALEITVQLGGAMLLPNAGVFSTLEIREGTATGHVIVNLLDPSVTPDWALKPGADYYLYADLIAPSGSEYIQIHYGGADAYNGVTFANPPGGKYEPGDFNTHDHLDKLVSYKDFPNPSYGSGSTPYPLQDGEMIYHIKQKDDDAAKNTVFAIGLVVKDAVYDGDGIITDAVKIAVGSYESSMFAPAQDCTQIFSLNIAAKGQSNAYMNPNTVVTAALNEKGTMGAVNYIGNIAPDQPEFLYDKVTFDLTYPIGAELEIGFGDALVKTDTNLGTMTVGEATEGTDGKTQTVQVIVSKGWKKTVSNGACLVRLNFNENAGFKPGETHALTLSNVQVTTGTSSKAITIRESWNKLSYTLSLGGQDATSLSPYHRIAYNHTIDAAPGSYLVPLGNAIIKNTSTTLPTPYEKTFEAQYNVTNTAANVSYITIPIGTNTSPVIAWSGIAADGTLKTGTIIDPTPYGNNAGGIGRSTLILLPAVDFGIVSFTGVKVDIGALPANYNSADTVVSWLFAKDNLSSAYGYFTTDEPGIQVINNYRLYNTDPALRDRQNGDLSATTTGTSTDLYGIGWNGASKLGDTPLTTENTQVSINAGEVAKLNGVLFPYTSPTKASVSNNIGGTATLVMDPIIYLTLPQGMTVVEADLKFELEEQDFRGIKKRVQLNHQIENVSYLNTMGDGVSIYKITFPKGTRFGYFDEKAIQTNLYYNIPLLTSKSLETRRYSLSELICVTAENQPEATKYYGVNKGLINYVIADKYGINGGRALGTLSREKDDDTGKLIRIGFGVQQSSEINLYSSVAVTKIGGQPVSENRWYSYSSDPNSIALLGQNSEGRLRLQVSNTSATAGSDLRIILPIPQKDSDIGDVFMDDKSGFTMSMAYDSASSNEKFTATYIKTTGTYDTITDTENIVSYTVCSQQEANAVMFTANSVEKGEYYIFLDFTVTNGTPKSIDIWRPVYAYTVQSKRNVSKGSYVASEVAASSISGVAFADLNRNGVQDPGEDGAADVTVVAKDAQNRIVSTKTAQDGSYHFLAIRESNIDMSFTLSAEGQKTLRFNVPALPNGTTGIASTVTPSPDGLTATKTFVAASGEERVHAAVDGFVSLSYDANGATGGNLPKTGSHVKGTSVTVAVKPDNLAKIGYTFKSWNTNADGSGTTYQPGAKITVSQSTTLYAIWELASYTITFNYRGATGGNDEASRVLAHNDNYGRYKNLPTPTKNGYTFGGWNADTTKPATTVKDATKFTLGADTTLYALWTPKTMKVTYNMNGGNGTIADKPVSWEAGVLPTDVDEEGITKNGFTLSGWSYNGTLVTETDTYGGLAVSDATASITLIAQWQAKGGYTVKYNTNGGSTIDDKTGVKWTDTRLLPPSNPAKAGNAFVGWKLDRTDVSDSSSYGSLATDDTKKEITLTAQWTTVIGNVVSYDTDGGSPVNDMVDVAADATNLLPTINPTKAGYTLEKWVVKGTSTEVKADTSYDTVSNTKKLTLQAVWKAKSYTVKYNTGGGSAVSDKEDVKWTDAGLLPTQSSTLTGYIFDGWYYNGTKVTAITKLSVLIPQDNAPNNTITLTAKWTERTYIVQYNSDGGGSFTPKTNVKYTATGLLPDVQPVRLGYTFKGWFVDSREVKSDTTCGSLLADDIATGVILTAKWDAKTGFTVQYDTDGGTQVTPISKTVVWNDTNLLPITSTTKTGYTFEGWLSGRTKVTKATAFSVLTTSDQPGTSVTLVAQWKENDSYTVKYNTDGGSTVAEKTGVKWTETALLPSNNPTYGDHAFVEWQYNGVAVTATDSYGHLAVQDTTSSITLKAIWKSVADNTVKYSTGDGGTVFSDKTGVKPTDKNLLPLQDPERNGYQFAGWKFGNTPVTSDTVYSTLTTAKELTLTAQWTEKSYTVSYDVPGYTSVSKKWTESSLLPNTDPTRSGYTFEGWYFANTKVEAIATVSSLIPNDDAPNDTLTLRARWVEKSGYTVKYNTDGGSAVAEKTGVKWTDTGLLPASAPTKEGYTIEKWQLGTTDVTATHSYGALAVDDTLTEITLKAVWTKDASAPPDIFGTVEDEDGNPVENAIVRLTQGNVTIYGPTNTNAQGQYRLSNLQPGIYNLVAEKGNQIVTVIVTVIDRDLQQDLVLPAKEKNSVLDVKGSDTPAVVVGKLDEIAKNTPLEGGSTSLTIKLTVQKEAEQTSGKEAEHRAIRTTAGTDATILFLDAVLTKQIDNSQPLNIGNSNDVVLEVVIPFDLAGKENVRVCRHHDTVNAFRQLSSMPDGAFEDETFYLDESAGLIHVYAQKYSTYAIAYDTKGGGGEDPGGGGSGGGSDHDQYYDITLSAGEGGRIQPNKQKVTVREGNSAGFDFKPDTGYRIADVKVDGRSIGAVESYLFRNVRADHTLSVSFEKVPVTPENPDTGGIKPTPPDKNTGVESTAPAVPEPPAEDELGTIKRDILDDLSDQRDEAISGLPETLTPEQRQTAIDAINQVYDELTEKIKDASSSADAAELFNKAKRDFERITETPEKVVSTQGASGNRPFILLSALLALLAIICTGLVLFRKRSKKSKAIALVAAITTVVVFFLTSGWSGIKLANIWTLLIAILTIIPVWLMFRRVQQEDATQEE